MRLHYDVFNVLNMISVLLFISTIVGSHYLSYELPMFTVIFQIYVGILLVYKFNMFMPLNVNKTDQQIIYTAGVLLLTTQFINIKYMYHYVLYKMNL
jgi:hypothetical protein